MINELIKKGEGKTIEFKEYLPQKNQISKTVCAFANRAGGQIFIGINDSGSITGINDDIIDEYLDRISNIIHDTVYPMLLPELFTYKVNNKNIIVIKIYPGSTPPYYLKNEGKIKGTYVRVGKTNKPADIEMISELERRRLNITFDEDIFKEADDKSICDLRYVLVKVLEKEVSEEKLVNLNLIHVASGIKYMTNAAAILLGAMDNCRIKCARFMGDSVLNFIDRKEYSGDLFEQINSAIGFIKSHINLSGFISNNGLRRKDILEIPEEVIREAVINAVVHRDYSISGSDIKIAVYNSYIDVVSPGGLPKSITVEEIYAGRSEIRNKIIVRIFKEAGIIEQWGSGIPRMREACAREGLKLPEISEEGLFVKLTISRRVQEFELKENGAAYYRGAKENLIKIKKSSLIEKEKELILQLLKENANYTIDDISKITDISPSSTQRRLQSMQKEGKIRRIGSKKSGKWEVI